MRLFIASTLLLLSACSSGDPKTTAEPPTAQEEVVVSETSIVPDYVSTRTRGLINPAEIQLSPAARARMEQLTYTIPAEDIVVGKTIILKDGDSNVECQIPKHSMVASEGNSDGAVYIAITPDHADSAFKDIPVCDQERSIMSGLGWAMAFLDLKEQPKS